MEVGVCVWFWFDFARHAIFVLAFMHVYAIVNIIGTPTNEFYQA